MLARFLTGKRRWDSVLKQESWLDRRRDSSSIVTGGRGGNSIRAQIDVIKTGGHSLLVAFIFSVKQEARNQLEVGTQKLFEVRETEGMEYYISSILSTFPPHFNISETGRGMLQYHWQ